MGVPEGEERQQAIKNLFEKIRIENFPTLVKEIDIQVQTMQSSKQDELIEAQNKIYHK